MLEVTDAVHRRSGARAASACTSRRAATRTPWAIPTRRRPSATSPSELGKRGIAFICAREARGDRQPRPAAQAAFGGVYIANEGFTRESAEAALAAGEADAVAFGKAFIANPDLAERLRRHAPLNAPDPDTFYAGGAEGYTDYPTLAAA